VVSSQYISFFFKHLKNQQTVLYFFFRPIVDMNFLNESDAGAIILYCQHSKASVILTQLVRARQHGDTRDDLWSNVIENGKGAHIKREESMSMVQWLDTVKLPKINPLSTLIYYYGYAASVGRYIKAHEGVEDARTVVDRYHETVARVSQAMDSVLDLSIPRSIKSNPRNLFRSLFPDQRGPFQSRGARLFVPGEFLTRSWMKIHWDGAVFQEYGDLREIAQYSKETLLDVKIRNMDNAAFFGSMDLPSLGSLSIVNVRKGSNFFSTSIYKCLNLRELRIERMPLLVKLPDLSKIPNLLFLYISDVSVDIPAIPEISILSLNNVRGLKRVPTIPKPSAFQRLILQDMPQLETLPDLSVLTDLVQLDLTNLRMSLTEYKKIRVLTSLTRLTLNGIELDPANRVFIRDSLLEIRDQSQTLEEMKTRLTDFIPLLPSGDNNLTTAMLVYLVTPLVNLTKITLGRFVMHDFRVIMGRMRKLQKITILDMMTDDPISLPVDHLSELKKINLGRPGTLSPNTAAWYAKRRPARAQKRMRSPAKEQELTPDLYQIARDSDERVALLESMEVIGEGVDRAEFLEQMITGLLALPMPFGAWARADTNIIPSPPFFPPVTFEIDLKALWLSWDNEIVEWITDETEGLLLDVGIPPKTGIYLRKSYRDDGRVGVIVFESTLDERIGNVPARVGAYADLMRNLNPIELTYFREARFVDRDERLNQDIESDTARISFAVPKFDDITGFVYSEMAGQGLERRVEITYMGHGVEVPFGHIAFLFDSEDAYIPSGFEVHVPISSAIRMYALLGMQSLCAFKEEEMQDAGELETRLRYEALDASVVGTRDARNSLIRYLRAVPQTSVEAALLTLRTQRNPADLNTIRYDVRRNMQQGVLVMIYALAKGCLYVLDSMNTSTGEPLVRDDDWRDHIRNVYIRDIGPQTQWISAWYPAELKDAFVDQVAAITQSARIIVSRLQTIRNAFQTGLTHKSARMIMDELFFDENSAYYTASINIGQALADLEETDTLGDALDIIWRAEGRLTKSMIILTNTLKVDAEETALADLIAQQNEIVALIDEAIQHAESIVAALEAQPIPDAEAKAEAAREYVSPPRPTSLRPPRVVIDLTEGDEEEEETQRELVFDEDVVLFDEDDFLYSRICAMCKKGDARKYCTRCKKSRYCSRECQSKHWSAHKFECAK
jgi:hypothetical protein